MIRIKLSRKRPSFNRLRQIDDSTQDLLEYDVTVAEDRLGVTVDTLQFPVHDNGNS